MSKRSGYRIRLEWFVPFDPADIGGIGLVNYHMDQATAFGQVELVPKGALFVNIQTKYQARREVPDAPAGDGAVTVGLPEALTTSADGLSRQMPPIPASLDRRSRP